ncbi:MAG TPA: GNAT family N-acetyltransferase [Actinomycetota bacterium]|nr:GNAT family N-acetyltransferase [Actinomycetota bacterium]
MKPWQTDVLKRGPRVVLRHPADSDHPELMELIRSSRAVHRPWVYLPENREELETYMARTQTEAFETLLVCDRSDGSIVGVYNLSQIFRGAFQNAYLSYYVGAHAEGRGAMSDGLELVLAYAFTTLRLHRIEANIQPGNVRSIALVKRAGLRKEGFSPRYLKIGGRWRDHERWGITVEDWRELRAR